jgi:ABC transport system ATP-binding/permease protein
MTESMLKSLMKLFALLASINMEAAGVFSRNFVESYLRSQFSNKLIEKSLEDFDSNLLALAKGERSGRKRISSLSVKILMICDEINRELHLSNKYLILFSLIQFAKYFEDSSNTDDDYKQTITDAVFAISDALLINQVEYNNCSTFISDKFYKVPSRSSLLVVSDYESFDFSDIKHLQKENMEGQLFFLRIRQAELYIFYYSGKESLELGGRNIFPKHVYVLPKGSSLKSENFKPLYYSDVVSAFRRDSEYEDITLTAKKIEYIFPNSDNGVHEMNIEIHSGDLVGVMGSSGTGKSTLMKVLNGSIMPDKGEVLINGVSLSSNDQVIEGMIGFVPQDDLLIEELSVFENLFYNAKLCLGDLDEKEIIKRIGKVLNNLDLFYIKDLKVGSPLNKFISGGQRKRLNIALELIREPFILFVDEPTSGLSSTDSDNVMCLLKEQALSGKIIVVNIHQPSSDLFKLFGNIIIMDKGGYAVYTGNPLECVSFLKNEAHLADAAEIECEACGNVETQDILKIIEAKKVNELGEYTRERMLQPKEWYNIFKKNVEKKLEPITELKKVPPVNFKIPSRLKQFKIYSLRNFFSKLADRQFVMLALTITPALAFILGSLTKYLGDLAGPSPEYVFSLNENIPAYIFMSVIVALFVGMIISAEEIIKDRKILERESYLNLSKFSYLNSKITFLFGLSAFQILVFVLIGNGILEIRGMTFSYWIVLFSTSCFAVLLGLNISSGLKSVISIYMNIPFILVPLILLSGVIVKYDKLHVSVAGHEFVPIVGDVMASRWAYEALVVRQYMNNEYEKHFYTDEKENANALYNLNFLIPELQNRILDLESLSESENDSEQVEYFSRIIRNTTKNLDGFPEELIKNKEGHIDLNLLKSYISQWKEHQLNLTRKLLYGSDRVIESLIAAGYSKEEVRQLKQKYHNESIEDLVKNSNDLTKIVEVNRKLLRKDTPVFQKSNSKIGRAQFFAGSKYIGKNEISTIWFNVIILWLMSFILYIALLNDWLRKLLNIFRTGKHNGS